MAAKVTTEKQPLTASFVMAVTLMAGMVTFVPLFVWRAESTKEELAPLRVANKKLLEQSAEKESELAALKLRESNFNKTTSALARNLENTKDDLAAAIDREKAAMALASKQTADFDEKLIAIREQLTRENAQRSSEQSGLLAQIQQELRISKDAVTELQNRVASMKPDPSESHVADGSPSSGGAPQSQGSIAYCPVQPALPALPQLRPGEQLIRVGDWYDPRNRP